MAYCAICGQDHEPGVPCAAHHIRGGASTPESFARAKRAADRFMIEVVVGGVLIMAFLFGAVLLIGYLCSG